MSNVEVKNIPLLRGGRVEEECKARLLKFRGV